MTPGDHGYIDARMDRLDGRIERAEDRVDKLEGRFDKLDGMMSMLRLIFGVSVIGALAGILALVALVWDAIHPALPV